MRSAPSRNINIYIAGDYHDAKIVCRQYCLSKGFCVTVTPTEYVYTGGAEFGVIVGIINYPRFAREPDELFNIATELAEWLMNGMYQKSATIETPDRTYWLSRAIE